MNNSSPPKLNHRTTTEILQRATQITSSILPTFLFLSLLLFSFQTLVENGTVFITSFIDKDPSLKSLLSHLDDKKTTTVAPPNNHRPHRPFLHLTRVGTLDDDFFSGDDDSNDKSIFGFNHKTKVNSSYFDLSDSHFYNPIRNNVQFKIELEKRNLDRSNSSVENNNNSLDLLFTTFEIKLGRRDAMGLLFLVSLLSSAYAWVIIGFVVTYSWALGVVFISVTNNLLDRYATFAGDVFSGSNLGAKKICGFVLMRWAVRDALTQVIGLWYFGEIGDQYSFFKLFLRLKLMPFSVAVPWVSGYEDEVSGFLFAWYFVDSFVAFVFTVDCWVTIENRRRGWDIVKEGYYLLDTMRHQSIQLKCLELILCGGFTRWGLGRVFGRSIAVLLQSFIQVYFMVAWLIFYFAARSKDAMLNGRSFGRRELEGIIDGLR